MVSVKAVAIPGMLIFGTATVVSSKLMFELKAKGKNGDVHEFKKPWAEVLFMFLGMCSCLVVHEISKLTTKKKELGESTFLLDKDATIQQDEVVAQSFMQKYKDYFAIFAPAMADLLATSLMYIGLLWVPASIFQLLRGSMVIFSSILSVIFLKKKLYAYNLIGIGTITFAMVCVGISSVVNSGGQAHKVVAGIILIVSAQVVQASQIVIEEFLLTNNSLPAMLIVGMEGFWGTIVAIFIVLPIVYVLPSSLALHEDSIDTLIMLGNSGSLLFTTIFYIFAILGYNLTGMLVTQTSSAIHRTILEAVRTSCIWITDLVIYYAITKSHGEEWTYWSWLELVGFVFLLFGTFIYNKIIFISGLYYPPEAKAEPIADDVNESV